MTTPKVGDDKANALTLGELSLTVEDNQQCNWKVIFNELFSSTKQKENRNKDEIFLTARSLTQKILRICPTKNKEELSETLYLIDSNYVFVVSPHSLSSFSQRIQI